MKQDVYWHGTTQPRTLAPLRADAEAEVVIVGGGMAGLSAAQWLREHVGVDTVLLDGQHCGAGASGHNSGSIIPDAMQDVHQLLRRFGMVDGGTLARAATDAVQHIRTTIKGYGIDCDPVDADTLYVGSGRGLALDIEKEHQARERLGLPSRYCGGDQLQELIGSRAYSAGVVHGGTLGMNSYKYVLGLRDALIERGLRVYENTRVLRVEPDRAITPRGVVRARHVMVCVDRLAPALGVENDSVYHQQHFMAVSEPLGGATVRDLFPDRPLLVHGLGRLYHYFRLTPEHRLVLGGMPLSKAYSEQSPDPAAELELLTGFVRQRFPMLQDARFSHGWSRLFGLSKDLLPIAGRVPWAGTQRTGDLHAALCGGSMAWSLLAGQTAAQAAIEGSAPLERFFAPRRAYTPLDPLIVPLGKSIAFPLANLYSATLLKGTSERIARQQRWVRAGIGAVAAGAAVAVGRRWLRGRTSKR